MSEGSFQSNNFPEDIGINLDLPEAEFSNHNDSAPEPPREQGLLRNSVTDAYFEPKSFESEGLYRALGVTAFKKIVPTSGDYAAKLIRKINPNYNQILSSPGATREEQLKRYEGWTRVYEAIHVGGFAVIGALQIDGNILNKGWPSIAAAAFMQTSVNIYPIMLQRYNRLRINRTLERMSKKT